MLAAFKRHYWIYLLSLFLISCTSLTKQLNQKHGQEQVQHERFVPSDSEQGQYFLNTIQPIIENRCSVCHGCYDAPCQLKLTSAQGIDRGSNPLLIYHASRLTADTPHRLGIDAKTTEQWRTRGFSSVLNERTQSPANNLQLGLIYQLLEQKILHPLPEQAILPKDFDLSLNRKQSCPKIEQYPKYIQKNPLAGMPYALPAISTEEFAILSHWIAEGAKMAIPTSPVVSLQSKIHQWEQWLNRDDLKQQLASRYIYEHWFLANLYFSDVSETDFFHLVRSATPPGEPVQIIATRRPYDDPLVERVYYRLLPNTEVLLYKTHMPYALNEQRLNRLEQLFIQADYVVDKLPSYDYRTAANPFLSFISIPAQSRYQFMLDEAQFTIMGFIKGPVCRGNVALNVINDHFWVFFVDPNSRLGETDDFIASQVDNIGFPAENQSFTENIRHWSNYSKFETQYLNAKSQAIEQSIHDGRLKLDESLIWNGGTENNDNAALTVFRHFDSATVLKGLIGQAPQTAWVIDYTLLERIHYLLVAGFDVYGNFSHQALTRLHMDFLRLEGEFNFLALLPPADRLRLRDHWYRNADNKVKSFIYGSRAYLDYPPAITYHTDTPEKELGDILKNHLSKALNKDFSLNNPQVSASTREAFAPLLHIQGQAASIMPEASVVLLERASGQTQLYSILSNHAYSNLTSMFAEQKNRLYEEDNLSVTYGVATAYPSVILRVKETALTQFIEKITQIQSEEDYAQFLDSYGVRRTHADFWPISDLLHQRFKQQSPLIYGLLDYNRLENR